MSICISHILKMSQVQYVYASSQTLLSFHSLLNPGPTFTFNNSSIFWFCGLLSWEAGNKTVHMQEKFQNVSVRICISSILRLTNSHNAVKSCEWNTGSGFVERMCVCVNQEAIERKEKRARRFHFCVEESSGQRNVLLDKDMMKKGKKPMQVCRTSDCSQVAVCTHHVCVFDFFCGVQLYPVCVWRQSTWQVWTTWAHRTSLDISRNILQHISSGSMTHPVSVSHTQSQYWPQFSFDGGCGQVGGIWSLPYHRS